MKLKSTLVFILISVAIGLATAFLVLLLVPNQTGKLKSPVFPSSVQQTNSWANAVALAEPSVVNIYTSKITREPGQPLFGNPIVQRYFGDPRTRPQLHRKNSLGSGVVIDRNGYILTNHHVVKEADDILIVTEGQAPVAARIVGTDPDTDLAVIQAAGKNLPAATLGSSAELRVGDIALAIGNPFGVGKTVTQGIISATGRQSLGLANFEDFIQTDAAINRGNSGGALINARGEVIGINTAILSSSGGSHGIGFAIPIDLAKQVMQQIIQHGRVIRGWIGASGQDISPAIIEALGLPENTSGVLITAVLEGGPADSAGLLPGDVIYRINGKPVHDAHEVMSSIARISPGQRITLDLRRGDQTLNVALTVIEKPENAT